jgi:hypothetical protein
MAVQACKAGGVTQHTQTGCYQNAGFYSAEPATYWSTSSVFAIWWCAILQVKEQAIKAGVWHALKGKQQHRAHMRDAVPDSLRDVKCLIIGSTWTKKDIYEMYIYILDPQEEAEVSSRIRRYNVIEISG